MQLIFITHSGRHSLSLKLTGWRLTLAALLAGSLIVMVVWAGIALGSFQGSLTERLMHIWQVSRSDSVAREIGQLKAKIEMLESSMQAIQDESGRLHIPQSDTRLSSDDSRKPAQLRDLQGRAQKIAMTLDVYSASLRRTLASRNSTPVMAPIENAPMSSNFGWRDDPLTGMRAFHSGIDWISQAGTPVFAVSDGVVLFIGPASAFGNLVEVRHGDHVVARYAHLEGIEVTTGMPIVAGQRIGRVGSTGRSTGAHLHFELLVDGSKVNPEPFFARLKSPSASIQSPTACCALANTL